MVDLDKLKLEPEVSDNKFTMCDTGAVELETAQFVWGFIKRLKPENVLSTGVYTGISDLFIADALKENGFGHLTALEFEAFHIDRARKLWEEHGVFNYVTAVHTPSLDFKPDRRYQFMFLDTELNLRFHELVKFFPFLDEGGYILIHDMPRGLCQGNVNSDHPDFKNWPVGELPEEFNALLREQKIVPFHFGSARGLVGYYKVHPEDYERSRALYTD